MRYANTLDIRDLAREWQDLYDEQNFFNDDDLDESDKIAYGNELAEQIRPYADLCDELGIAKTPEALSEYGENEPTMIATVDFPEYAEELAEELGYMDQASQWPFTCIDWDQAARDLSVDYSICTYDGTDYYIRSW